MAGRNLSGLHLLLLLLFLIPASASTDDVKCLQEIKKAIKDPKGHLSNWSFTNTTAGFICSFSGVDCWNDHQNRLLKLNLHGFNLSGHIPDALRFCTANLQHLDISGNAFSGSIPSSICTWSPYLVAIDFSSNRLTGEIPIGIGSCQYLYKLDLSSNRLSGGVPLQLASLRRLIEFSVANNNLEGSISSGLAHFDESDFAGNHLRGKEEPLSNRNLAIIVAAEVFGALASLFLGIVLVVKYF